MKGRPYWYYQYMVAELLTARSPTVVNVPRPERYAVHKLNVCGARRAAGTFGVVEEPVERLLKVIARASEPSRF